MVILTIMYVYIGIIYFDKGFEKPCFFVSGWIVAPKIICAQDTIEIHQEDNVYSYKHQNHAQRYRIM